MYVDTILFQVPEYDDGYTINITGYCMMIDMVLSL